MRRRAALEAGLMTQLRRSRLGDRWAWPRGRAEGGANKGGVALGAGPRRWYRLGAWLSGLGSRGGGAEVVAQG